MAENSEATSYNNLKEASEAVDPTQTLLQNIQEILKLQNEQKQFNEKMLEKISSAEVRSVKLSEDQQKMMIAIGELQTKTDNLSEVQQKISISNSEQDQKHESESKSIDSETSSTSYEANVTPSAILPATGKSFVLKHAFKNVLEMKVGKNMFSNEEEHFGVPWKMMITRNKEHLGFYLHCSKSNDAEKWSIEMEKDQKLISARTIKSFKSSSTFRSERAYNALGFHKFIKWEEMETDYMKDGKLNAEIHVKINKTTGIYKDKLRSFDESMEKHSDVVLIVKDTKFYVSKLYLATHSPYFDSLFFGQFQESKKSEIKLSGIDVDDFQNYLEVLYSEDSINETTVEGILLVADMYDTPIVIKKCQKFLMKKTKKTLKRKLEMSTRYNLDQLKKKCMSEINSTADIKSVLPAIVNDMDHSTMAELLEKAVEFQ